MAIYDLPYDYEDFGLSVAELMEKHPDGHEYYTREMWRRELSSQPDDDTYWEWVVARIEEDDESIPCRVNPSDGW